MDYIIIGSAAIAAIVLIYFGFKSIIKKKA